MTEAHREYSPEQVAEILQRKFMVNFIGACEGLFKRETGGDSFDLYTGLMQLIVDRIGVMCDGEKPMQDMLRAMADQLCSHNSNAFRKAEKRQEEARQRLRACFNRVHGAGAVPGLHHRHRPRQTQ